MLNITRGSELPITIEGCRVDVGILRVAHAGPARCPQGQSEKILISRLSVRSSIIGIEQRVGAISRVSDRFHAGYHGYRIVWLHHDAIAAHEVIKLSHRKAQDSPPASLILKTRSCT